MGEHAEKLSVLLEHPFFYFVVNKWHSAKTFQTSLRFLRSFALSLNKIGGTRQNISNKFDVFTLICTIFG